MCRPACALRPDRPARPSSQTVQPDRPSKPSIMCLLSYIKSVSKTSGKKDFAYNYVCLDIFTGEEHEYQVRHNKSCDCPFVFDSVYEITGISADGVLSLATKDGKARAPLSLPPVLPPPHKREPRDPRCDAECGDDCHIPFLPRYRERF
ncbi:hypothetical protein CTI12_AA620620 [Artemisia annua]|uniref:Uncharacterized protein n=1 Tax=Artemisia annua TaxID=35608 RepID=A0A2U1KAI0_ARTAN|nr:hypothetical protein CTI12_AA620620 [Artemisia annua]